MSSLDQDQTVAAARLIFFVTREFLTFAIQKVAQGSAQNKLNVNGGFCSSI